MKGSDDIITLKGIGEKTAKLFYRMGIHTVQEMLFYYPRDYQAFKAPVKLAEAGEETVTLELFLTGDFKWKKIKNLSVGSGYASDGSDRVSITYFNTPYLKKRLSAGSSWLFRGKVRSDRGKYHMDQPKLYTWEEYEELSGKLWPCYGLTQGLTNRMVIKAVEQVLAGFVYGDTSDSYSENEFWEILPEEVIRKYNLMSRKEAFGQIHFPRDRDTLREARRRLAFEEFFLFLICVRRMKDYNETLMTDYLMIETAFCSRLLEALPYRLTNAQLNAWKEIVQDLTSGRSMNRLIQGDVGSGKTILAFLALLLTVSNGFQGALMAPTEILAAQHFEALSNMKVQYNLPFKPVLLTGSLQTAARKEIYREIEAGEANVIIGTHALIQEKVNYQNLALVITDEQHRFGVRQRESFCEKGGGAHVLVMSATPIPRTLAMILYGDMHLSVIDELPAGRIPVKNCVVGTSYRPKAYEFIAREVRKGNQAYVICPMVEAGEEETALENVIDYGEKLRKELPADIHVEILHGKMKAAEKKRIMEAFSSGNVHVLVSTTVIEVGINVPAATVMMIENAERFGLAQLHQLRGRIGRGNEQSYCIFISGTDNEQSLERLKILNRSNDGFYIAREDLKLRGPGDLFGIRQSGVMDFRIADVYQDAEILEKASDAVNDILAADQALNAEKYAGLKRYLNENAGNFVDFRTI